LRCVAWLGDNNYYSSCVRSAAPRACVRHFSSNKKLRPKTVLRTLVVSSPFSWNVNVSRPARCLRVLTLLDTIRDAILTCARKPTLVSLICRLEIISGHRLDRLMLSVQAVRGLPHLRTPGIVPCIISTSTRLIKFKYSFYLTFCVGLYIRLAPPPMSPDGVKCLVKITKAMQLTHNVNNSCTFFR